jgi:hypothetical protein
MPGRAPFLDRPLVASVTDARQTLGFSAWAKEPALSPFAVRYDADDDPDVRHTTRGRVRVLTLVLSFCALLTAIVAGSSPPAVATFAIGVICTGHQLAQALRELVD